MLLELKIQIKRQISFKIESSEISVFTVSGKKKYKDSHITSSRRDSLLVGLFTYSSILAWKNPMDRGAWWLQSTGS